MITNSFTVILALTLSKLTIQNIGSHYMKADILDITLKSPLRCYDLSEDRRHLSDCTAQVSSIDHVNKSKLMY